MKHSGRRDAGPKQYCFIYTPFCYLGVTESSQRYPPVRSYIFGRWSGESESENEDVMERPRENQYNIHGYMERGKK